MSFKIPAIRLLLVTAVTAAGFLAVSCTDKDAPPPPTPPTYQTPGL